MDVQPCLRSRLCPPSVCLSLNVTPRRCDCCGNETTSLPSCGWRSPGSEPSLKQSTALEAKVPPDIARNNHCVFLRDTPFYPTKHVRGVSAGAQMGHRRENSSTNRVTTVGFDTPACIMASARKPPSLAFRSRYGETTGKGCGDSSPIRGDVKEPRTSPVLELSSQPQGGSLRSSRRPSDPLSDQQFRGSSVAVTRSNYCSGRKVF